MKERVQFVCHRCYRENRISDVTYYSPSKMRIFTPKIEGAGVELPLEEGGTIQFPSVVSENNLYSRGILSEDGKPLIAICKYCFQNNEQTEIPEEIFQGKYKTLVIAGSKGVGKTELFTLMTDDIQKYGQIYFDGRVVNYIEDNEEKFRRKQRIEDLIINGRLEGTASDSRESIIFKVKTSSVKEDVFSIYDAAGERFDTYTSSTLASHSYFRYATGIFLLIDILQLSGVKSRIRQDILEEYSGNQNQDLLSIISNLTKIIRTSRNVAPGTKISVPLAVILTKVDTILEEFSNTFGEEFIRLGFSKDDSAKRIEIINNITEKFLIDIGETALISQLRSEYSNIKFFTLASRGINFEIGEEVEPFLVELPLIWLMKANSGFKSKIMSWFGGQ